MGIIYMSLITNYTTLSNTDLGSIFVPQHNLKLLVTPVTVTVAPTTSVNYQLFHPSYTFLYLVQITVLPINSNAGISNAVVSIVLRDTPTTTICSFPFLVGTSGSATANNQYVFTTLVTLTESVGYNIVIANLGSLATNITYSVSIRQYATN